MITTIVFDFENSIMEKENVKTDSIVDLVEKYGLDPDETAKFFISYMLGDIDREKFLSFPHAEEVERAFLDSMKIKDDVKDKLKSLSEKFTLALFSSLPVEWFWYIVKKNGIEKYFKYIVLSSAMDIPRNSKDISKILHSGISESSENCMFVSSDKNMKKYIDFNFVEYDDKVFEMR